MEKEKLIKKSNEKKPTEENIASNSSKIKNQSENNNDNTIIDTSNLEIDSKIHSILSTNTTRNQEMLSSTMLQEQSKLALDDTNYFPNVFQNPNYSTQLNTKSSTNIKRKESTSSHDLYRSTLKKQVAQSREKKALMEMSEMKKTVKEFILGKKL